MDCNGLGSSREWKYIGYQEVSIKKEEAGLSSKRQSRERSKGHEIWMTQEEKKAT